MYLYERKLFIGSLSGDLRLLTTRLRRERTRVPREYDNLEFTVTVANNGTNACGFQLKVSTYNKSSSAIETKQFCPANVRNIAPGTKENFSY